MMRGKYEIKEATSGFEDSYNWPTHPGINKYLHRKTSLPQNSSLKHVILQKKNCVAAGI